MTHAKTCKKFAGVLCLALAFALWRPTPALAAVTGDDLQTIQRRQEQIIQQQEERLRVQEEEFRGHAPLRTPVPGLESFPPLEDKKGDPCLEVADIRVLGTTLISGRAIKKLTSPYVGQCLTLAGINNLLRDITNAYIEKGYITSRAFIDTQSQEAGVLQILVIEGKVERLIFNDGDKNKYYQSKTAFPFLEGKALNLRDIEQGLDQLNRLPSNNATMELVPGTELGATSIRVYTSELRSYRGGIRLDNLGQRGTGKTQYSLSFEKDNYFGLGDQIALYWTEDTPFWKNSFRSGKEIGHNNSFSGYFSLPFGYWSIYANASVSRYKTTIYGAYSNYRSSGETNSGSAQLERVIYRNSNSKTSALLGLSFRDTNSFIENIQLESSSYSIAALEASLSHNRRILGGTGNIRLAYTRGLPWFGAGRDFASGSTAPKSKFDKYSAGLNWYRPFSVGEQYFYWSTAAQGQLAAQTLYGAERLSIGGYNSVRGFDEETLSGDKGLYLRNELGWNLPWFERLRKNSALYGMQIYAAYDYGHILKDQRDPYERGSMQGVALGLRSLGEASLNLTCARSLQAPGFIKKSRREIYASVSYSI